MSPSPQWLRTARIVRRLSFGATGAVIDEIQAQGVQRWLDQVLVAGADATDAPTLTASTEPVNPTDQQRQEYRKTVEAQVDTVIRWWLRRMISAPNPVQERLTFGWHDHWATGVSKVRNASAMLTQNQTLRRMGTGSFTDLAHAMVVDPALMIYLDAPKNTKAAPNENLAREFMELFTLGRTGGYTETDVREAARALTGWRITSRSPITMTLDPKRHDTGSKTFLGVTGNLNTQGFVDAVLAVSAHPGFVATRWWQHLAAPDAPPSDTLARLTAAYGTSRDLRALFRAIVSDPAFAAASGSLVVSPVEWVVSSMRLLSVPVTEATLKSAVQVLRALGQLPLNPPNVAGWPTGQAWLSTAAAQTRSAAAQQLVKAGDLKSVSSVPAGQRLDATARLLGLGGFSPSTSAALSTAVNDPASLVAAALISPENLVV